MNIVPCHNIATMGLLNITDSDAHIIEWHGYLDAD
jgi:hypothetical protein